MIFITGSSGFVGQNLTKLLLEQDIPVLGLDIMEPNLKRLGNKAKDFNFVKGSTTNTELISSLLQRHKPTQVIHMGMVSTPTLALKEPEVARQSIFGGTKSLLCLAKENGCKTFIHFSSSHVYGDSDGELFSEGQTLKPKSLYGKLKKEIEDFLMENFQNSNSEKGMVTHIIRPTSLYGPFDPGKRVVSLFIEKALKGEEFVIKDTKSKLDFTYIDDFTEGVLQLLKSELNEGQAFNLARGQGRTLLELAQIIKGLIPQTQYLCEDSDIEGTTKKGQLDISRAKSTFGFNPKTSLETGVKRILKEEGAI